MSDYPLRFPAVAVKQPLGLFYVASIPARILLENCYSERLSAETNPNGKGYILSGTQRELMTPRLKEIGAYINSPEAAFPNSIILAANFRQEDGTVEEDESVRWRVEQAESSSALSLIIPSRRKLAPVIDGQYRLFAFSYADKNHLDIDLVCSVFLDLPRPFQAFLFATINSTQKSVDRSQTYELFGYNVENEPPAKWSPDKLAVFLSRKLAVDDDSPFSNRIIIAAETDLALSRSEARQQGTWMVSMATVVDGIIALISRNPRQDGYALIGNPSAGREATASRPDNSPLRTLYVKGNDKLLHLAVLNFFKAAKNCLWSRANRDSYITKNIGIQALFDIFRMTAPLALEQRDFSEGFFEGFLSRASSIDFSASAFANPSGSGRIFLRKFLMTVLNLSEASAIAASERESFIALSHIAQLGS